MEEIIKTVNGLYRKKEECRYIDKEYYIIGDIKIENSGDVYLINDRYIRLSTGKLIFNHSSKQYQLKKLSSIEGIIGFNDSEPIMGYFDIDNINNVKVVLKNNLTYQCINEKVINLNFREKRSSGVFYHITLMSSRELIKILKVDRFYKESLNYDSKNILDSHIDIYNNHYNPIIDENIKEYSKTLEGLTFGLEFETVKGQIPKNKINYLPLIPLRDGSIDGLEYVTIPLSGDKGLQAVIDSVKELKKRTEYNDSCSLHLHIGNVPRTPEFILAFYRLVSYYQEEMFQLFPIYKQYNFGVKKKNYSKPFPVNQINFDMDKSINIKDKQSINRNFKILFDYLSMGQPFESYDSDLKHVNVHPTDPLGNAKWNIRTRYHAVNFIPLIFGNKSTIEFRIHTPTYDINKVINFLFINSILINYAKSNTENILKSNDMFKNNNLYIIIKSYLRNNVSMNSEHKSNLIIELGEYLSHRKNHTYNNNCEGNIKGDEDNFKFYSYINYESLGNESKNKNLKNQKESIGIQEVVRDDLNPFSDSIVKSKPQPIKLSRFAKFFDKDGTRYGVDKYGMNYVLGNSSTPREYGTKSSDVQLPQVFNSSKGTSNFQFEDSVSNDVIKSDNVDYASSYLEKQPHFPEVTVEEMRKQLGEMNPPKKLKW